MALPLSIGNLTTESNQTLPSKAGCDNQDALFIEYHGPKLSRDPAAEGNYGKHNLRQLPLFLDKAAVDDPPLTYLEGDILFKVATSERGVDSVKPTFKRHKSHSTRAPAEQIPSTPKSYPGLEMTPESIILLQLMPLTGLRLGIGTSFYPSTKVIDRRSGLSTCHLGSRKLISFIPCRYGKDLPLTFAIDCVVAKLRQMTEYAESGQTNGHVLVLSHYNKALRAIQAALSDKTQCMSPETLCAVELMGVFEMLDGSSGSHTWKRHAGGAARLMQARGACEFKTPFEMALFLEQIGPSVTDAFLSNRACFLADKPWLQVLHAALSSDETFADQKALVSALWQGLVTGPKLVSDAISIISSGQSTDQAVIEEQIRILSGSRADLKSWLDMSLMQLGLQNEQALWEDDDAIFACPTVHGAELSLVHVNHLALRGAYIMCRILKARLLYALAPTRFYYLEVACQELSAKMMAIGNSRGEQLGTMQSVFASQSLWLAQGISSTKDIWSDGCQYQEGMIEKWSV
ncbi:hypothetical protein FALBO_3145 [Fusarium albosuccineum]|uniref:Uncharacterized protein n=1 Tax=Fusarium albosuccineum TaxID=1237068 RepID=A0A8H4LLC4_9HYPO|nr:hypothetical protein FALBO_3145 [Fusarium albosuccineum]